MHSSFQGPPELQRAVSYLCRKQEASILRFAGELVDDTLSVRHLPDAAIETKTLDMLQSVKERKAHQSNKQTLDSTKQ